MTDDFQDQVRATLRQKAAEVRVPGGDAGLDAIHRKLAAAPAAPAAPARRPRAPWLVAAAAAVVVAVVGGSLVARTGDDRDRTVVAGGGDPVAADEGLLEAVWPTDSPTELASMDDASLDDPRDAAAAYLSDRLGRLLPADAIDVDLDAMTATLREDAAAPTVALGELDGRWYVRRATTDLLAVDLSLVDGDVAGSVVPGASGDLTVLVDDDEVHQAFADAGERVEITATTDGRAVVRSTRVGDAGNATFDERLLASGAVTGEPALDAVWPSDDPEVLRGISASWARDPSPLPAVRLYLQDRLQTTPSDEHLVVDGDTVTVTEETNVVVHLGRLDGQIWYVERATSGLLDVDVSFDGERVRGGVVPGSSGTLEISYEADGGGAGGTEPAVAEVLVPMDYTMPASDSVVTRVALLAEVGIVALDERRLAAPEGAPAPDMATGEPAGVWPKGGDDIPASDLTDPVGTAARYIEETVGASNGIVLSEYRQGDSNSGEVEVTGDLIATIALRQIEGRWHVEAVHTPLVEARGDVPGELWLHANLEGNLVVTVLDHWGTVVQSMPSRHMNEGEEVVVVPAEPVHKPFSVRYRFEPAVGNPPGIGDVAVAGNLAQQQGTGIETEPHEVPAEALHPAGGLDPIGTAQGYIEDRLGFWPDDMRLSPEHASETIQTVDWSRGSVTMVRHDGYWYVIESIGASVSFESITRNGDDIDVQVFLGEEGTLLTQVLDAEGVVCAEVTTDVEGRGGSAFTFEDVLCEPKSVVATMNEVIAEQSV